MEVRRLSKDILDDFLFFFDHKAFTDNPEWSSCYCFFYHFPGSSVEWAQRKRDENRNDAIRFIKQGKMNGYLAYDQGSPVGWCNVNRKSGFDLLLTDDRIRFFDDESVASIVCFLIDPDWRRRGVAGQLLRRVCEDYQKEGFLWLEAYPRVNAKSNAENFRGPVSLYRRAGFFVFQEHEDLLVLRKQLLGAKGSGSQDDELGRDSS